MTEFLPPAVRNRLLRRGLAFQPDAVVANGDHVYWDLLSPGRREYRGLRREAKKLLGNLTGRGSCLEATTKRCSNVPLDRRSCPSTEPTFVRHQCSFFKMITITSITMPPRTRLLLFHLRTSCYSSPAPRRICTIRSFYRTLHVRWAFHGRRRPTARLESRSVSARSGMGDWQRFCFTTSAEPKRSRDLAPCLSTPEAEKWLMARSSATNVTHVVHGPSNPPGWSAGKWGEWYPDVTGSDRTLTTARPKAYWQSGWLKQHDRLMQAISAMRGRVPLVISGDMHAIAMGRMMRSGALDLTANPVNVVLSGPVGTGASGWPSTGLRGTPAQPPTHLDLDEQVKPIEQHGFTLADFTPDKIVLQFVKWDVKMQPVEAIDTLQPFHTAELHRPT